MPAHTINAPPPNRSRSTKQLSQYCSPLRLYTWGWRSALYNKYLDASENITLHHWRRGNRFGLCCMSHAILTWRCRGINGIPTYGRRGRKPNSQRRFLTVSALIRLLCVPGVTWAISTTVRNRLRSWDRHMYRSCWRVVTCGCPLLGLSFVIPVYRRRWYKQVIVDLLTWKFLAMTAWDVPHSSIWTAALRWSCVKHTMFHRKILPDFWNPNSR